MMRRRRATWANWRQPSPPVPKSIGTTRTRSLVSSRLSNRAAASNKIEAVAALISHGADVNARNVYGYTPLMMASYNGHAKVVEALLDAGADKELKDLWGETALDIARRENKGDVVAILERRSARRQRQAAAAAEEASATKKKELSAEEQKKQNKALYDAAQKGDMGKLEAAIAAGAEVDWHHTDPDYVSELSELE